MDATKIIIGTAANNLPSKKLLKKLRMIKVKGETSSFRNDDEGNPIEFVSEIYELNRK